MSEEYSPEIPAEIPQEILPPPIYVPLPPGKDHQVKEAPTPPERLLDVIKKAINDL